MEYESGFRSLSGRSPRVCLPRELLAIALLVATLGISGCNSSGDDSSPSLSDADTGDLSPADDGDVSQGADRPTQFGNVSIGRSSSSPDIVVFGGFSMPEGEAAFAFVSGDVLMGEPVLDTCSTLIEEEGFDDDDLENIARGANNISAGETITLRSSAGTWLTLSRIQDAQSIIYLPEVELPSSIASGLDTVPNGLVIDIPGDDFPAFTDVLIPDVAPLSGVTTNGAIVTPATLFQWDAGSDNPSVFIVIELESIDEETSITCSAADDGEFSIPDELRTELGSGFRATALLTRLGQTVRQSSDAVFVVNNFYLSETPE